MASDLPDHEHPRKAAPPLLLRRDQITLVVLGAVVLGWLAWDWLEVSRWGAERVELADVPPEEFGLKLDPNTATWIELAQLPGVGETIARRIVAGRGHRPFSTIDDLRRVRGIGPKLVERIGPYLRIGATTQPQTSGEEP